MTANSNPPGRLDPRRAEVVALGAAVLHGVFAFAAAAMAANVASDSLGFAALQLGAGIGFWLLAWGHLRLRRLAREEALDLEQAEQRRRRQGLESLFENGADTPATRALHQMERWFAPAAGVLLALFLLTPTFWYGGRCLWEGKGLFTLLAEWTPLATAGALPIGFTAVAMAFACFILGMYAAGLARESAWSLLRAGAGNAIAAAIALFLIGLGLVFAGHEILGEWPDRILAALLYVWITLHALEILVNFVLDFYRPRVAGVPSRPAYDSRLTGLLAEPDGLFRTFAHTMDYQFGFQVSETWFFRFLEKAFAPLFLIQLLTLYLLTCLVPVRPGEVAVIEHWGAPRGVDALPADDAAWDSLAPPLAAGLHLKWPWPIETARYCDRERVTTMHVGYQVRDEAEAAEKAAKLAKTVRSWDVEHVADESKYLMPLPSEMIAPAKKKGEKTEDADEIADDAGANAGGVKRAPDTLFLSGEFAIEYRVGTDQPGNVYRFLYAHRDPRAALRSLFEREVTAYLAGAHFWKTLSGDTEILRIELLKRLRASVLSTHLGIEIVALGVYNLHPPTGDVGKAFQKVLGSHQESQADVYAAEGEASEILRPAASEANRILSEAEGYRNERTVVSQAEAERFRNQETAYGKAPEAFLARTRMRTLEESLAKVTKTLLPREITTVVDSTKALTPDMLAIEKGVQKQEQK